MHELGLWTPAHVSHQGTAVPTRQATLLSCSRSLQQCLSTKLQLKSARGGCGLDCAGEAAAWVAAP